MMKQIDEFLKCPICGNTFIDIERAGDGMGRVEKYIIDCGDCGNVTEVKA